MIADQYYENNCYHVTMANEGKDLMISCQHFVDSHMLEASATQITHFRLIRPTGFCSVLSYRKLWLLSAHYLLSRCSLLIQAINY